MSVPLNVQIEWELEHEKFKEIRFTYDTEPEMSVPCHLLIPHNAKKPCHVVICLQGHSTGMHRSMGRRMYEKDAKEDQYEKETGSQDRDFALQAVEEGLAALCIEQRGFGERISEKSISRDPYWRTACHTPTMAALLLGRPIFDEARLMGVEFIPLFNSLGHAGMGTLMDQKNVVLDQNPRYELLFEPNGWSFCISNPETIELINTASDELMELMGPGEYFHIGLDESVDFATCDLCSVHNKGEFLANFVNGLAERMRAKGRRTMIWADMLLLRKMFDPEFTYRKGGSFSVANACDKLPTHEALGKIDKDVIIVDWQYFTADKNNPTSKNIAENGCDVVTASYNNFANMQLLAESAAVNNYFGYMSTEWGEEKLDADLMLYSADVAWNGKEASLIDSFRLEERFHAAGKLRRKLLPSNGTMEDSGWF